MGSKRLAPLLVIVGQTASGKSGLALEIAKDFQGAIICADSRTVYKEMDIGTAKPTPADRAAVPHFGLDIASPDQSFTAADFKAHAYESIDLIAETGRLPILVGGTGLYVDSFLYDFDFRPTKSSLRRELLELLSIEELQGRILQKKLSLPTNSRNKRHLIRVIETEGKTPAKSKLRANTYVIGLRVDRDVLKQRIESRITEMFDIGLESEARRLYEKYGSNKEALTGIGYREFTPYFQGVASIDQVRQQIIKNTLRYAKRQKTWFKRNSDIVWFDSIDVAKVAAINWIKKLPQ
jgi:tRNA dimethylallyltransferase